MSERRTRNRGVLLVLRHPGYRRFLTATIVASSGLWVCETALLWLIQAQTHSAGYVGLFLAIVTAPFVIGAFWGGLLTDRFGPRPLMASAAIAWSVAICIGALLAFWHSLTFAAILGIGLVLGAFDSGWTVPMQIMAAASVNRELTAAAVGAFPIQYGVGRVIGGIGGGFLVAAAGVPAALVVSCAALAIAGLMLVGIPYGQQLTAQPTDVKTKPGAAFRWLVTNPAALTLLTLAALTSLITSSYLAVLPAIAVAGLGAGATGLGLLTAASGVGILVIIVMSDWVGSGFGKARLLLLLVGGTAVALVGLAVSTTITVAAIATGVAAGLLMLFISNSSLVLQALSPLAIKGQAVSILSLIYWGFLPVGAVLVGSAADRFGARVVLIICAALSIAFVLVVAAVRRDFSRIDVDSSGRQIEAQLSARDRPPGKEVMR